MGVQRNDLQRRVVHRVVDGAASRQRDAGRTGRRRYCESASFVLSDELAVREHLQLGDLPVDGVLRRLVFDHDVVDAGTVDFVALDV